MTAISLHVGLNHVSPEFFGGWEGWLSGCLPDTRAMSKMAAARGWSVTDILLDERATKAAVIDHLTQAADFLQDGDRFLLTYSGHGGQVADHSGDEDDARDETWCLWNGMLVDDQINLLMARFRPGVRVIVVSDSCHSGTVTRAPMQLPGSRMARAVAAMPVPEIGIVHASGMLFSGCTDDQLSSDLNEGGRFTVTLLHQLARLREGDGWLALEEAVRGHMPPDQQPGLFFTGRRDEAFIAELPVRDMKTDLSFGRFWEVRRSARAVSFEEAYRSWQVQVIEEAAREHPDHPPYPLTRHDGCTVGPELCRPCCFGHDVRYWYAKTSRQRADADAELYACILSIGGHDEKYHGWFWKTCAYTYWACVRIGGKNAINGGRMLSRAVLQRAFRQGPAGR